MGCRSNQVKPLRIFTPVWGDEHIHRFEIGLVKSMCWPKNKETLTGNVAYWHVFTVPEDMARITQIMERVGHPYQVHGMDPMCQSEDAGARGTALANAGLEIMSACLVDGSLFMTAFSDIVFADGSLEPMFAVAQRHRICVSVPHMRVLPAFLNHLDKPLSNPEMVSLALATAHPTWTDAEIGIRGWIRPLGNQFYGGLSWEKFPGYYLVQHCLPNIWMANIEQADVELIRAQALWGAWDHNFPSKVVEEGRSRVLGSSDAAFMVEVTEHDKGIAPSGGIDPLKPDAFHHDTLDYGKFHGVYRNYVSVFREA